jgi:hypothetical protein
MSPASYGCAGVASITTTLARSRSRASSACGSAARFRSASAPSGGCSTRPLRAPTRSSGSTFRREKRLEALATGTLFAPGRLTVELLRCRIVRAPFVFREIGSGHGLLVIENHTTFDSVVRSGVAGTSDIGFVAYGARRQFEASVEFVRELHHPVTAISYFGDLDDPGLSIAVNAARNADRAGLPPITPAEQLYSLLLEHGRPAPWERTTSASRARRLVAWPTWAAAWPSDRSARARRAPGAGGCGGRGLGESARPLMRRAGGIQQARDHPPCGHVCPQLR